MKIEKGLNLTHFEDDIEERLCRGNCSLPAVVCTVMAGLVS